MRKKIAFVGMDVHKDSVTLAVLIESESETEWVKTYPYDLGKLRKVFNRLSGEYDVRSCYEASGAGYCLHRTLQEGWGVTCDIVAPSLIPKRSGDRRKTDRRDAENLAQLYRAGQLTPIRVPDAAEESVRDLCRCRETFGRELLRSRHYVLKFLRRRGFVYRDGSHWTRRHMAWIRSLELEETDQAVLDEYVSLLEYHLSRAVELDRRIEELAFSAPYKEMVSRVLTFRGLDTRSAMTLVTELGDVDRFGNPRQLMAYLGLTPSEHSSGEKERRGPITKTGNSRCRHILVQAAWNYRFRPHVGRALAKRQKEAPAWLVGLSWKAQHRLNKRFHRLTQRKSNQVAVVAVARELVGFLWAALTENGSSVSTPHGAQPYYPSELRSPTKTYHLRENRAA